MQNERSQLSRPEPTLPSAGQALIVEAEAGILRQQWLSDLAVSAAMSGSRVWRLSCDFWQGGPWAGIRDLFASQIDGLLRDRPDLVQNHDYELVHVLPELKRSLQIRNPTLTDTAAMEERVRNYPVDRAYRIVHGLIDLLSAWKGESEQLWVVLCEDYDRLSSIGRRFFREWMRRRGSSLPLGLVVTVSPGKSEEARQDFSEAQLLGIANHPEEGGADLDPAEAARQALALEERVTTGNPLDVEINLADLIRLWRLAGRPEKVATWQYRGLDINDLLGFYEEAVAYGEAARAFYRTHPEHGDDRLRLALFMKLFMAYVALQQPEKARVLAEEEAVEKIADRSRRSQISYLLSMLYSRYMPQRDLARGEALLEQGLHDLERAGMSEEKLHFQRVFNRNGLAMIRHFQGRYQEAMDLCRQGYEELEAHLPQGSHRLHRSVLLYNLAQVAATIGAAEDGLKYLNQAMEMDPNYSEYYNDRGNLHLSLGLFEEARADYLKAIELSPPYHEVQTNLGQCYRRMSRFEEAIGAYSASLDLNPGQPLALLGRAQCWEALGRLSEAIGDYTAALTLAPESWEARASRAIVLYELGRIEEALNDLDHAIKLAPETADLYQNRAVALADLGRFMEAIKDLETYCRLAPEAEDLVEVEARIAVLASSPRPPSIASASA